MKAADERALAEAAGWFARLGAGEAGATEDWRRWLAADPAHAAAWTRVESINGSFAALAEGSTAGRTLPVLRTVALREREARRRQLLAVCALGMFSGVGSWLALGDRRAAWWAVQERMAGDVRSALGEVRALLLADGSRLTLNTASRVAIDYTTDMRRLRLFAGELRLDTAADPRPLAVDTVHGRIMALGTRFVVRREAAATRVDVYAGAVRLEPAEGPALQLAAGMAARFDARRAEPAGAASRANEAWAAGQLLAENVALSDFFAEVGRHVERRFVVAPEVRDLRLVGVYRWRQPTDDLPPLLAAVMAALPVNVESQPDGAIHIVSRVTR